MQNSRGMQACNTFKKSKIRNIYQKLTMSMGQRAQDSLSALGNLSIS
jgi:hypothetical protein